MASGGPRGHRSFAPELGHAGSRRAGFGPAQWRGPDLVASHGQTVWHFDGVGDPGSRSLGWQSSGGGRGRAVRVCDFRAADAAAGGHGAPLSIHGDERLFGHLPRPAAVLNPGHG
ncbi:MAG: anhydro-N-acetylmuramic acid kinase [Planctomycetota bacterium]